MNDIFLTVHTVNNLNSNCGTDIYSFINKGFYDTKFQIKFMKVLPTEQKRQIGNYKN